MVGNIHFANNDLLNTADKLAKVWPLIDKLQSNFWKQFSATPHQNLGYDEAMIQYFGSYGMKQFIRGKPVRFGYKLWSLNDHKGYCVDFQV